MNGLTEALRKEYPHGHTGFIPRMLKLIKLHSDKNHDYAGGGHVLGNFTRVSTILSLYPDLRPSDPAVVAMIYALKQVDAVLWELNTHRTDSKVEGMDGRLDDIAVYAQIVALINEIDVGEAHITNSPEEEMALCGECYASDCGPTLCASYPVCKHLKRPTGIGEDPCTSCSDVEVQECEDCRRCQNSAV